MQLVRRFNNYLIIFHPENGKDIGFLRDELQVVILHKTVVFVDTRCQNIQLDRLRVPRFSRTVLLKEEVPDLFDSVKLVC